MISLKKDSDGEYKNTHAAIAHAMYLWGKTDGKDYKRDVIVTQKPKTSEAVVEFTSWEIEIPPKEWFEK